MEDDAVGYPEKFWLQLGEAGLLDVSELSTLDAVVMYQELGRAVAPTPHFVSAVMSAGVLRRADTDWLGRVTAGEAIITPAWLEPEGGFGPAGVTARVVGNGRVTGSKRH